MQKLKTEYKETKYGRIPYDWELQSLDKLCDILDSKRIPLNEKERKERNGSVPYYGATGIIDYIDDYIFDEKLICLAEDGENLRSNVLPNAFTIQGKTWVNNHAHVLRPKDKIVNHEYLEYFLNFLKLEQYLSFTAQPKLTQDAMKKIKIILSPIKEQQKIASILSNVDELIQKTEQTIQQTHILKKGLLQRLLTKGIGHIKFKKTELGEIPEEWIIDEIQNHSKITTGNKNYQDRIEEGRYPFFVRSQKIERINTYSFDGEAILTAGDGVGTGKVFHYINGKFDFHQRVYKISNFRDRLHGRFFYWYFSNYFLPRITSMSAKSSVDSVRMNMIAKMLIPLPSLKEQQKIASILSNVDELVQKHQNKKSVLENIKKGLMQQLLTGKIRVKI